MRILICGGRDYAQTNREEKLAFLAVMNKLVARHRPSEMIIIHGDCPTGADRMAACWAYCYGVPCEPYPVTEEEWKRIGPRAGPMRNQVMVTHGKPDGGLAFPGGRGTADMCRRLEAAGLKVWRPYG